MSQSKKTSTHQRSNSTQSTQNANDIDQLRRLLPGINSTKSKDEVMEAAAKYIETLQNNLVGQIRTHGYPDKLKSFSNRSDDFDSIRRAVDNYACAKMK